MPNEARIRPLTADDLAYLAMLGLDQTIAIRAMAQDMAWVMEEKGKVLAAATARLADGTVFLDGLVGEASGQLLLIDHAIAYARWSYAPALTLLASHEDASLEDRGFVGVDPERLPPSLGAAAATSQDALQKVLMKRL